MAEDMNAQEVNDRFNKRWSPAYVAAVRALRALEEAEGPDAAHRAYASAVSEELERVWAQKHDVRIKREGLCISHLHGKQCRLGYGDHLSRGHTCRPPGTDHPSEAKRGRETVAYISQPYQLSWRDLQEIVQFCADNGLEASVCAFESWYFPGDTLLVEYRRTPTEQPRDQGG